MYYKGRVKDKHIQTLQSKRFLTEAEKTAGDRRKVITAYVLQDHKKDKQEDKKMTTVKAGTKKAEAMMWEFRNCFKGSSIEEAYGRASQAKKASFEEIERRAWNTDGYNHDLKITGKNTTQYSTMYSYTTAEGITYIVKDTRSNTYILQVA